MNLADLTLARWRERRRARTGPDLADMGTAFGLDASFADEPDLPVAAAAGPVAGAAAPAAGTAAPAQRPAGRWWHRRP